MPVLRERTRARMLGVLRRSVIAQAVAADLVMALVVAWFHHRALPSWRDLAIASCWVLGYLIAHAVFRMVERRRKD